MTLLCKESMHLDLHITTSAGLSCKASKNAMVCEMQPKCSEMRLRCDKILRVVAQLHNVLVDRRSPNCEELGVDDAARAAGATIMQDQFDLDQRLRQRRRDREVCPLRVRTQREVSDCAFWMDIDNELVRV